MRSARSLRAKLFRFSHRCPAASTKIHFTDGANVRKGQLLFTIDPRPFEANLKQAQANLAKDVAAKKQAEANLAREVARENWGRAQVERYRTLVEQGVVAREQYEQLRADYDTLKANSEAARAAVRSADETIKVDKLRSIPRKSNSVTATSIRQSTGVPVSDWSTSATS